MTLSGSHRHPARRRRPPRTPEGATPSIMNWLRLRRFWRPAPLKSHYDVVIIGGGIHGLATAYYLAREHGIRDVAVLEARYIGFGGSGRNTAIVRANQRTAENVRLYDQGLKLWRVLTDELDFNLMFFNCGTLNLGHSEAALAGFRLAASTHNHLGVKSEMLDPQQCAEVIPGLDISDRPAFPVLGGMFHPPGGIVRHDAVVWGLAKGGRGARRAHPPGLRGRGHRHGAWPRERRAHHAGGHSLQPPRDHGGGIRRGIGSNAGDRACRSTPSPFRRWSPIP